MTPMDKAWALLKRQTTLGEFHPDMPSPHGPVTHHHATKDAADIPSILRQGLKPKGKFVRHNEGWTRPQYRDMVTGMGEEEVPLIWATPPGAEPPYEYENYEGSQMFGIRGEGLPWEESISPVFRPYSTHNVIRQNIPPSRLVRGGYDD